MGVWCVWEGERAGERTPSDECRCEYRKEKVGGRCFFFTLVFFLRGHHTRDSHAHHRPAPDQQRRRRPPPGARGGRRARRQAPPPRPPTAIIHRPSWPRRRRSPACGTPAAGRPGLGRGSAFQGEWERRMVVPARYFDGRLEGRDRQWARCPCGGARDARKSAGRAAHPSSQPHPQPWTLSAPRPRPPHSFSPCSRFSLPPPHPIP